MPRKQNPAAVKLFLWVFILMGLGAICVGANLVFQSLRCRSWPTTQGIIRTAKIGTHRSSKGGTTYSADVSYDYSVGGLQYTGTKVAFGMMSASSSYAHGVLKRYPVGTAVSVYYSPSDPEVAVLETGIHGGTWICFGVGSIFSLFGVGFLRLLKRSDVNQTAPAAESDGTRIKAPQILTGAVVALFGLYPIVMAQYGGSGEPVMYLIGGVFCLAGLHIMTYRPNGIRLARFFSVAISLLMLGVFHWLAFGGMGEIETFFAVILGVIDLIFLVVAARWLFKRMKVKARGL